MVMPLEQNYILSLRQWANEVIADRVVTTPHSAAEVVLELLDHIKFQQDMFASERYIRMNGTHELTGDNLRLCKVCKDRYATRGDGICQSCYDQWVIDQM